MKGKKEPSANAVKKQIVNLLYSEAEIENMKNFLRVWQDRGKPRFYEVYVADCCMVSKTDDLDEFDMYKLMVRPTSRYVKVKIFQSQKNRNNFEYIYHIPLPTREAPLNGVPGVPDPFELADHRLAEKQKEEESQMYKELYEENKERVEQLADNPAEENKPSQLWGMALTVMKGMIRRNPDFLKNLQIPGAETLTGVVMDMLDEEEKKQLEPETTTVSFQPVTEETREEETQPTTEFSAEEKETPPVVDTVQEEKKTPEEKKPEPPALNPEHIKDVVVMEELKSAFHTPEERNKAMLLVRLLKHHPELAMALLGDLIQIQAKDNETTEETSNDSSPTPVSHAPPEPGVDSETEQTTDVFFVEDLNL